MILSVALGPEGALYRLADGLVDEEEASALASAVSEMAQVAAAAPADSAPETTEVDFQAGSLNRPDPAPGRRCGLRPGR